MRVLGIETSCDETSAAVVEGGWTVRSNVVASQVELHAPYGGVVPELASRRHVELITVVIQEALTVAGVSLDQIEGIAVTNRPGLIGSLLVGVAAAKGLALARSLPLVGVHHLEGHIFSNLVRPPGTPDAVVPKLPAVALIASGGHTELYYVKDVHQYLVLGRRRDDAAGEAFDKGARVLGLGNGGGAALDALARDGDPKAISFPRGRLENPLDFSFSGVKTALIRFLEAARARGEEPNLADIAAGYQRAIVEALVERSVAAVKKTRAKHLLVGGGVAANSLLQTRLRDAAATAGAVAHFPDRLLCTDNAGMIAAAGHSLLDRGVRHGLRLETLARSPLTERVY